jgi:hypothetical protein
VNRFRLSALYASAGEFTEVLFLGCLFWRACWCLCIYLESVLGASPGDSVLECAGYFSWGERARLWVE